MRSLLLPALLLLAGALPAAAASTPFDPSGTLLVGSEKQPSLGKTPLSLHLGADGTAAASLVDPTAVAIGWTGTWTFEDGLLSVDLEPLGNQGDPVLVELLMKGSGSGKGTVIRLGTESVVVTQAKVKAAFPPRKAKGWTAWVPRLRDDGSTAAGSFRGTLVLRNLAPVPAKKVKPLKLVLRAATPAGLPGDPLALEILPGAAVRLEGGLLPPLPSGVDGSVLQVLVTGGKDLDPATLQILAFEEVLRGPSEGAVSGAAVEVRWVRRLKGKELASRETAPLAAPWFRDDGGAGPLPRDARLVLRDLSPFTGDAAPGTVRVSVRGLDGVEVASSLVELRRGEAVEVRPLDLLDGPGDLPGGEGSLRVTAADGSDLPRDVVGTALLGTVASAGVPAAPLSLAVGHPERAGRSARLAVPYLLAPDDGLSECRIEVLSLSGSVVDLPVEVLALDGTLLHAATVPVPAGGTVRVDPASLGMDLAGLPGGEGQVVVGGSGGLPVDRFLAHGETRLAGSPDTFFTSPVRFESAHGAGEPLRIDALDLREKQGSGGGLQDAWVFVRNGGDAPLDLVALLFLEDGVPLGSSPGVEVTVPAGASVRVSAETLLTLAGAPLGPLPDSFRGCLVLRGSAAGPVAASEVQVLYGVEDTGGFAAPAPIR